jgi:ribosomal protein S18 acetylase RimI-like enzyme
MTEAEYELWRRASIIGYASESVISGRWTREEADSRSEQEFARLLPGGLATPDNFLYSIVDDQASGPVGIIWFAVVQEGEKRHVFVYDFEILERYRRRGYGTLALQRLDDRVRAMGLKTISLHVFEHNMAARDLYTKAGYRERNIIMYKDLT